MNNHITYLFGAGASAQVIPVDNVLTKRLEESLMTKISIDNDYFEI
jgi:hypothetical protein